MILSVKQFKGIISDGDSADVNPEQAYVMVNWDVDKSTQKLVCRLPFYQYDLLGNFPSKNGYMVFHVLQYTVGIVRPQFNTMVILRSRDETGSGVWDWAIYCNGPMGGDGNAFILIAEEKHCTSCKPEAVLGKVRIALGNTSKDPLAGGSAIEANYRIFFPHTNENYFYSTDYAVKSLTTVMTPSAENAYWFKAGALSPVDNTSLITSGYLYMDGRLYTEWQATTPSTQYLASRVTSALAFTKASNFGAIMLQKGIYNYAVVPFFDKDMPQVGAPLGAGSYRVSKEPRILSTNVVQSLSQPDAVYLFEAWYVDATGKKFPTQAAVRLNYDTDPVLYGSLYTGSFFPSDGSSTEAIVSIDTNYPHGSWRLLDGTGGYPLVKFTETPQEIKVAGPSSLGISDHYFRLTNTTDSNIGETFSVSVTLDKRYFNPRLTHIGLAINQRSDELQSLLYSLTHKVSVREKEAIGGNSLTTGEWQVDPIDNNLVTTTFIVTQDSINNALGQWEALADTDGNGYRPIIHTEKDITRQMNQMVAMRNRLHAIGIDGDEGQELVARTPVSSGVSQLDTWFRPIIAHAGKGKALLYSIEFQDRLLWIQNNNLIMGSFGDSRRPGDYQFINTGTGIGTTIIRSIAKSNDAVFFCNYDGIFKFDGSKPIDLTIGRINHHWRYEISKLQKDFSFGAYNPKTNEYWLFIPDADSVGFAQMDDPSGKILIWDDNMIPGQHWREYKLNKTTLTQYFPEYMFFDYDNNFVFVDSQNFPYFWPGENITASPVYPILLELETQNLGQRELDMIPDQINLITEEYPVNTLNVDIYRNGVDTSTAGPNTLVPNRESFIIGPLKRRIKKLGRRRSTTLRARVTETYDPTTQTDPQTGASVLSDHLNRRPEIREINFDVIPNQRRI